MVQVVKIKLLLAEKVVIITIILYQMLTLRFQHASLQLAVPAARACQEAKAGRGGGI